jgi:NADPH2:quinone reductase
MPKKIIIDKNGGPEVLKYVDYTLINEKLKTNEIRIKHSSIGVNFIDTYHRSGLYAVKLPTGLGLEAVGKIVDVGLGVDMFSVGDRVGYSAPPLGAYCEIRDYPAEKAIKIPEKISDDETASVLLKGMTVEYLFNRTYKIKAGEKVLFHAAAGGVGLIACQWARAIGCDLIGTVGSEEKNELAKKNGCKYVINYKTEDVVKRVLELTGGEGVSVVYDGVGKDTFDISIKCLSNRGMFVSFGNASGMTPTTDLFKSFAPKNLFFTRPSLMIYNGSRKDLESSSGLLFQMIVEKKIKANLSKIYELKNAKDAHSDLEGRKTFGSLILRP